MGCGMWDVMCDVCGDDEMNVGECDDLLFVVLL